MNYKNAVIFCEDFVFRKGGFSVENGILRALEEEPEGVDLEEAYVIPGLVDLHTHGNSGADFSTCSLEELENIARFLAKNGTTSFAPASMTMRETTLKNALENAARFCGLQPQGTARLIGCYMEGPFLSGEKKGAQAEEHLKLPDTAMFDRLYDASDGLLKIVCIAPELLGSMEFIEEVKDRCRVSMAHSAADYDTAKQAVLKGATQVTHLFNGMPPFLHRAPGIIGAAAESLKVTAELICDGYHVHQSAVRAAFSMFSPERIILISDSLSCTGMPDGQYESGGKTVLKKNGFAVLEDGVTFAGSTATLHDCLKKAVSFGIRMEDAIRAATINPARALGADDRIGSISTGKTADFLVCGKDLKIRQCFIGGAPVL